MFTKEIIGQLHNISSGFLTTGPRVENYFNLFVKHRKVQCAVFKSVCVPAPEVVIMDENNHEVSERYYKAGSAVELTCLATQVEEPGDYVTWRHGDITLAKGIR